MTLLLVGAGCATQVIHERPVGGQTLVVTENPAGLRTLQFKGSRARQSVVKPGDPGHLELPYARYALVGLALAPEPRRVLVLGLGGGSLPMYLRHHYPQTQIDVVDINPDVADIARRFFGFREDDRMKVHLEDGRAFIERSPPAHYDLAILDAYADDTVPRHLATVEFLRAVRRATTPAGVVVGNVWGENDNSLYARMLRTYQEAFDEVLVLRVGEDVNRIHVALPRRAGLSRETLARLGRDLSVSRRLRYDLGDLAERGWTTASIPAVAVLRDAD